MRQSIRRIGFKMIPKKILCKWSLRLRFFYKRCDDYFPDTDWGRKRKHNFLPFILLISCRKKKTDFDHLSIQICAVLVNLMLLVFAIIQQKIISRSIK